MTHADGSDDEIEKSGKSSKSVGFGRMVFLIITIVCFAYLYYRLNSAAAREGLSLIDYMARVFTNVDWIKWAALMVGYSLFYFLIDTLVASRALGWFIEKIKFTDIMPVRASTYIISVFNEQVGKGAMALYLNRRHNVPAWEVGSVMIFIMFCEVLYLLVWATVGYYLSAGDLPQVFDLIPYLALGGGIFLIVWILYFRGAILPNVKIRDARLLHAFKLAKPWHYGAFFILRSPAILAAVFVYTAALMMFGVDATYVAMIGYLPIIFFAAAVPTPMRAAAITLWVVLFPENEGQMAAFGFVQHNFFILFNAAIGLLFWRRAQKDLFG